MLRQWQSECVDAAIAKYRYGKGSHFLCLATPGAGKTVMAANVAKRLLDDNLIDYVLCFSPSKEIALGLKRTFEKTLQNRFDGYLGSLGDSLTYQAMVTLDRSFWQLLHQARVLVVFDEIHHCAGTELGKSNRWGESILANVHNNASYTLALTGTPWRTDALPISLGRYLSPDAGVSCDYVYGLDKAISDKVCRAPKIVLIDNDKIELQMESKTEVFTSIESYLSEGRGKYGNLIQDENCIDYVLGLAVRKLNMLRMRKPNAGGLIVAASVSHAMTVYRILRDSHNKPARVVTYRHDKSNEIIDTFRNSSEEWIISVGMISEGTDIPRLQVCCHLTTVKTEMYFRQVLGRIMRIENNDDEEAWMYTFAEPNLTAYAQRLQTEVPHYALISKEKKEEDVSACAFAISERETVEKHTISIECLKFLKNEFESRAIERACSPTKHLESSDCRVAGCFRERVINAFLWT
ncbi:DEAD/DEAH box helicase [Enterovibrio norvegicus]|uniref:DEAD/DEAH box helicase n=1 Tax=Enterovibrio norvegicus TaxID=188144 RepID=UPI0024B1F907|nr:DEAD/DEAH box helicase family protein [Enterovibrio norvegicus]